MQQLSTIPGRALRGLLAALLVGGVVVGLFAFVIYQASPHRSRAAWKAFRDPAIVEKAEAPAAAPNAGKDAGSKPSADEAVDKDSEGPEPPEAESSKAEIVVYGRDTCANTLSMRKGLKKAGVSFRFVSVDDKEGQAEYFEGVRQLKRDKKERIVLPLVSVDGQVFMHPSLELIVEAAKAD